MHSGLFYLYPSKSVTLKFKHSELQSKTRRISDLWPWLHAHFYVRLPGRGAHQVLDCRGRRRAKSVKWLMSGCLLLLLMYSRVFTWVKKKGVLRCLVFVFSHFRGHSFAKGRHFNRCTADFPWIPLDTQPLASLTPELVTTDTFLKQCSQVLTFQCVNIQFLH